MNHHHYIQKQPRNPLSFRRSLLNWYRKHGRHELPWRMTNNAYHILVSEIMLQQTQVDTVLTRFYWPFLNLFPDLFTLKAASEQQVMHAWQGLGYYRRAGYLHTIAKETAPELPDEYEALIKLPGIGRNTAHALLAFAHHQPYAVMEANVKRVLCRLYALSAPKEAELWTLAQELLNKDNPFDHNQAMMDLGAMICTPKNPDCSECPVAKYCEGKKNPTQFPAPKEKTKIPVRQRNIVIVRNNKNQIYAMARGGKLLGGLYQFIELDKKCQVLELNSKVFPQTAWQKLGNIRQQYSHFILQADIYSIHFTGPHEKTNWHHATDIDALPWSNAEKKILALLSR